MVQPLYGGLPLRLRTVAQALHQPCGGRRHARCTHKPLQRSVRRGPYAAVKTGQAGIPHCGHARPLPVGHLRTKGGIAGGEILRAVVAQPGTVLVFRATGAHAAGRSTAFVKHMHHVACLQQRLRTRQTCQACANGGNGLWRRELHDFGSVRSWVTQISAWVSMPQDVGTGDELLAHGGASCLVRDKIQQ